MCVRGEKEEKVDDRYIMVLSESSHVYILDVFLGMVLFIDYLKYYDPLYILNNIKF